MANPTGEVKVKARGKEYRLHLGMTNMADLQEAWGDKFDAYIDGAAGDTPSLRVAEAIIMSSLERYHGDEADKWLVNDLFAENKDLLPVLLAAAFPDPEVESAPKGKKKAAA